MGTFHATIQIGDREGRAFESVDAMVDTGSTYTWVPRDVLAKLGVQPEFRREFVTADGREIERDMAQTWVRHNGSALMTLVVFGDEGSTPLIGAYTLEGFGLAADPVGKRLIPVPGYALKVISLRVIHLVHAIGVGGRPCHSERSEESGPSRRQGVLVARSGQLQLATGLGTRPKVCGDLKVAATDAAEG